MKDYLKNKLKIDINSESDEFEIKIIESNNSINPITSILPKSIEAKFDYVAHYEEDHKYNKYFEEITCLPQKEDERRLQQMILEEFDNKFNDILDVGCGGGWLSENMVKLNKNIVSMDLSPRNVGIVLEKNHNENHYGIVCDALNHPFKPESFDFIVSSEVIEHVESPEKFINSLLPLLKSGGKLVITTPYKEVIKMETCIHCNHQTPRNSHLHSFNENTIKDYTKDINLIKRHKVFGNKALRALRTYVITKYLPLFVFKIIDNLANLIVSKPAHLMVIFERK